MKKDFIFPANGMESLKLKLWSDLVEILQTDEEDIKITIDSDKEDKELFNPQYKTSGNKIIIEFDDKKSKIFNFSFGIKARKIFKVFVPNTIKEIELSSVSGDVLCNDLNLKKIDLKTVSGDISITKSLVEHIDLNSTSGDFKLDSTNFISGNFKSTSGDCFVKYLVPAKRKIKMKTVSGDLLILYTDKPKAKISISTTSGDINADFPVSYFKNSKILFTSEETEELIEMKSVSGDIILKSKNKEFAEVDYDDKSEIDYQILDKETLKILQLLSSAKIDEEYTKQMLELVGYNSEEIEKMIKENKPDLSEDNINEKDSDS